ncbi:hypothetical protein GCM10010921_11290 [Microbacterium album]|uniref:Uncharacterized protein n=2 Tax=Microbacterium album TaxID=2053191 RepID=A0A917IE73_9MICO|nr:hypothetical protein GCM10010921_11290 [Microbacterium album]
MERALRGDDTPAVVSAPAPTPAPTDAGTFVSALSSDGSVSLSTDIADQLELRLDVWIVEPKRAAEWTAEIPKAFGYAVNVYDHLVDEKAVLADKRRAYLSSVAINSRTSQGSGQVASPLQFSADPRALVPRDTLRSERGLLLNSYQGGFLVPQTRLGELPADTYGVTLEFALTVEVEDSVGEGSAFGQQTVYEYVPIAITTPEQGE